MNSYNQDQDHDRDYSNDNAARAVAPAPAEGALTALTALGTVLNKVDTTSVTGRTGMPMLQFKSRAGGIWSFGQKRTIPEDGSEWAANPTTFKWGYVCFRDNKVLSERLVSVSQKMPDLTELPDLGVPWQPEWAVNLKCLNGADAGAEVVFKMTTDGGVQAIAGLLEAIRDRLNGGQHGGKVSPVVLLEKDSYVGQYGETQYPLLTIVDWMPLSGPTPAPKPTSPPPSSTEQPRRRRVA